MEATDLRVGRRKLKRSLSKPLAKVRLSKRGKMTADDKRKIKKSCSINGTEISKGRTSENESKDLRLVFIQRFRPRLSHRGHVKRGDAQPLLYR